MELESLARWARMARRQAFVDAGLWPTDTHHARVCCDLIVRGHDLRRTLLIPALGDELHSTQLFYLLADAHELGTSAAQWVGGDPQRAGRACAAVAIAVALVERVIERHAGELMPVLAGLVAGDAVERSARADVRIAMRAIEWARPFAPTDLVVQLARTVQRLHSTPRSDGLDHELGRARFELVFAVMRQIVGREDARLDRMFEAIARAFVRNRELSELTDLERLDPLARELTAEASVLAALPPRLYDLFASYARRTFE